MHVVTEPARTPQKKSASPPATAKQAEVLQVPRLRVQAADVSVITGHKHSPTPFISSSSFTNLTRHRPNDSLTASLRRKFKEVKNSGLALRRSISSAGTLKPSLNAQRTRPKKQRRSKSESLGQGSSSGPHHLQGLGDSSILSLSSDISERNYESAFESDYEMEDEDDVKVPLLLQQGTLLTKISAKKRKTVTFKIDADDGYILWESKKSGIIPIENIKEIRSGIDARYYREQFQLSQEYEPRWITIVYIADGRYKTLHLIAANSEEFDLWDSTIRAMYSVRQELMSGLGHVHKRQNVWERRYWRRADEHRDDKLSFEEVEKMCRRININLPKDELKLRFQEADVQNQNYLNFSDFRRFVKLLKRRPEVEILYDKLRKGSSFDFIVFKDFMRNCQKAPLSDAELAVMFEKYATLSGSPRKPPASDFPPTPPTSEPNSTSALPKECAESPLQTPTPADGKVALALPAGDPSSFSKSTLDGQHLGNVREASSEPVMSLDSFTTFLLSNDNSIFSDHHGKIWQDMTRPLPEYYVSSSHNTYLVGHQLVGVSTIEGYIRALLHSCRSVEIDVYDGETEPVIYHGKTLTSKVPLRDICEAIKKYAFVASPYPIIISAEVHCNVVQQDTMARIMRDVFGEALVTAPVDARPEIIKLPSPEELRGRILLKAKSLYVSESTGIQEKAISVDTESSDTSASDAEFIHDIKVDLKEEMRKARNMDAVKEIREEVRKMELEASADIHEEFGKVKEEFSKARNLYERVRRRKSPSPAVRNYQGLPGSTEALPGEGERSKVKISFALAALLVYTIGVKCRGFNKKETYAANHIFSLSERTANKVLKQSMLDLVKHNRTHLVRIYPNGTRLNSSNFEPHKYWAAGAQLVAINWQTFDLGYMINHAMFQRNGRSGYVLKPDALRNVNKDYLAQRTNHILRITVISAQQLPRHKDYEGKEVDSSIVDPYVEVSIFVPDWARSPFKCESTSALSSLNALTKSATSSAAVGMPTAPASSTSVTSSTESPPPTSSQSSSPSPSAPPASTSASTPAPSRVSSLCTAVVKNNGFNPVWNETLSLPFDVVADMRDLVFVRFSVRDDSAGSSVGLSEVPLAVYCCPLGSMQMGYRHLPLHDAQLSQYLFSTLFVHVQVEDL